MFIGTPKRYWDMNGAFRRIGGVIGLALGLAALAPAAAGNAKAASKTAPPPLIPIADFAQLPKAASPRLSPDGKHLAWLTSVDGRMQVAIKPLDIENSSGISVPPTDKLDINWIRWANNERLLISLGFDAKRMDYRDKTRETRLISITVDGKDIQNVVIPDRAARTSSKFKPAIQSQIQDRIVDILPNDPAHILVMVNDDQDFSSGLTLRKIDVATGRYSREAQRNWILDWYTDQSGQARLASGYKNVNDSYEKPILYYRPPGTDNWDNISESPLNTGFDFIDFYPDPRYAYVTAANKERRKSLYKYDLEKQEIVEPVFSRPDYDIDGYLTHPISGRLAGVSYIADKETFIWFDEKLAKYQKAFDKALPNTVNKIVSANKDGDSFILYSASDTDPGVYYIFNKKQHTLSHLAVAYPNLEPSALAPMREVSYKARDGLEIEGYLTLPLGREGKKLPTIMLPHGGPWARDYKDYDFLVQFLANRGYAVFQPNFRGSTGYGADFREAGNNQWGLAMQDDVTDGAQWLIDQGVADPARMCILGGSYGGYAALMGAVKTPDLFKCAVSFNGVSDLSDLIRSDERTLASSEWIKMIGDRSDDRDQLRRTSPRRHIDKIKIPILLVHAKSDMRVDYSQSEDMADALEDAHKPVKYIELGDGGHSLENAEAREIFLTALEKFLAENLGG